MIFTPDKRVSVTQKLDSEMDKSQTHQKLFLLLLNSSTTVMSREEKLKPSLALPKINLSCSDSTSSFFRKLEESNRRTFPEQLLFSIKLSMELKTVKT